MKHEAWVAGIGMTRFGRHIERSLSDLAHEAIRAALDDVGLEPRDVQAAWAGIAGAPVMTEQTLVAGQMILRGMGLGRIPVINVENACATASTAFQQACAMVTLGVHDVVLAFGVEKMVHPDKARAFALLGGAIDTERPQPLRDWADEGRPESAGDRPRSLFMDIYARLARDYSERTGASAAHYARIAAKNSRHGSLNPLAQFREELSVEDVLAAPLIAAPLTLPMCSPIGDGAAAAVITSPRFARERGLTRTVQVRGSALVSSFDPAPGEPGITAVAAHEAYAHAAIDPRDIDCVELHDATAPAELICCEALGLCAVGEGLALLDSGATTLGGRVPVNPSGGLVRKGHPIGATGLAQIAELVTQLRGQAGARQVEGARIAVAENGGGFLGRDAAVVAMTVLAR